MPIKDASHFFGCILQYVKRPFCVTYFFRPPTEDGGKKQPEGLFQTVAKGVIVIDKEGSMIFSMLLLKKFASFDFLLALE
jgi:hypothetical protein